MPHLQLDVPNHYPLAVKRDLAGRLGRHYAEIMQTTADLVHVTFRELGEGGVWHCTAGDPVTPRCRIELRDPSRPPARAAGSPGRSAHECLRRGPRTRPAADERGIHPALG
jgi:phenylpyruvate tautomerase PptA (4-oxalocrotonate tautomerase family)